MTTVILADDHNIVRQGLAALLLAQPDFKIVGQAADGIETISLVERLKPDVLVLDLMMPGMNGLEVTRRTRKVSPWTRAIILSMHADDAYVLEALSLGASAYVLKKSSANDLVRAIHEALAGRRFLSSPLSARLLDARAQPARNGSFEPYASLTAREKQVLQMVAEGNSNAAVAARLSISPRTVEMHRAGLMHKLRLENQGELIRYALLRGIIKIE